MHEYITLKEAQAIIEQTKGKGLYNGWLDDVIKKHYVFAVSEGDSKYIHKSSLLNVLNNINKPSIYISEYDYEIITKNYSDGVVWTIPMIIVNGLLLYGQVHLQELKRSLEASDNYDLIDQFDCDIGCCGYCVDVEVNGDLIKWNNFNGDGARSEVKLTYPAELLDKETFSNTFLGNNPTRSISDAPIEHIKKVDIHVPLYFSADQIKTIFPKVEKINKLYRDHYKYLNSSQRITNPRRLKID